MTPRDFRSTLLSLHQTLRQVMDQLDRSALGIILVVDDQQRLLATLTDGDVRRAILAGLPFTTTVQQLIERNRRFPITAPAGSPRGSLAELMARHGIRHIPLLDSEGRVQGLSRLEDVVEAPETFRAVVMAGGQGQRLRPLTENVPKPLLPVGDQPLLERLVERLRDSGVHRVSVTTHFLGERIRDFLGDGSQFGLAVDYVQEDRPLGTAGSLGRMDRPGEPVLVINGDILTRLNFRSMLEFHADYQACMTVAVKQYDLQVPYGVVECDHEKLLRLVEKPNLQFFVVAGIYLLSPEVWDYLNPDTPCDMPDLIEALVAAGQKVVQFPISEYWLDIGSLEHYQRAQHDADKGLI